nr:unnamed protein product [Callosobruchus analis]
MYAYLQQSMRETEERLVVEDGVDLSSLTDPNQEQPTLAWITDRLYLFNPSQLRWGMGTPALVYQTAVERKSKDLECRSDSEEESEHEEVQNMEDTYRPRSLIFVIEERPIAWTSWVFMRPPRHLKDLPPLTSYNRTLPNSNSTEAEDQACAHPSSISVACENDQEYYKMEQRKMKRARRMIRREKAERIIVADMKRMSALAFEKIRNSELAEPMPEVVDLELYIDFFRHRGEVPLKYRKIKIPKELKHLQRNVPSSSSDPNCSITKELTVNLCRMSAQELEEAISKKDTDENQAKTKEKDPGLCCKSLSRTKVASKGKSDDSDSDLENSNLENSDHESNQRASREPDKRVLAENVAAKSLLANVPGLSDFHLMQPQNVDQIINVAQVPAAKTQNQTTSQTSTPVTAHIQRIGQPRLEQKPENATPSTSSSTGHTTTKPSTLINILSQHLIRPANTVPSGSNVTGNSNGHASSTNTTSSGNNSNSTNSSTTTPTRRPPFINILSQQIIRPTQASKGAPNNGAYTVAETVLVSMLFT